MAEGHEDPTSPVVLNTNNELDELVVVAGESYLLDVTDFRKTQPEYYAMRSAIEVLREQAKINLDDFLQKARSNGLTVCVIIHGFNSSHEVMQTHIGSLDAFKDHPKMVRLYIDWDTQLKNKALLFFFQGTSRIITDGIENAYDIHAMLRKAIQKHVKRYSKDNGNKDKLSVIVLAHSMGSHVAEAFIKENESINLRGVIYFNPHTDHTFYNIQHVQRLYMNSNQKKGFVLVFNSSNDRVLGGSSIMQKFVRNFLRSLFSWAFPVLNNSFIRPLGGSWEKYKDKATKGGHRVVVLHMKHKSWFNGFFYALPGNFLSIHHSSYLYNPCRDISNAAIKLAMTRESFHIRQVQGLVKNKHLLEPKEEGGLIIPRPYGKAVEYVNMEPETENSTLLSANCAKIRKLESEESEESVINETTPLTVSHLLENL